MRRRRSMRGETMRRGAVRRRTMGWRSVRVRVVILVNMVRRSLVNHTSVGTALLSSDETLYHKGCLAEPCNLLLHGDAILTVGSVAQHGLLLLVVLAGPPGENAADCPL